jgi:hypothetical protein
MKINGFKSEAPAKGYPMLPVGAYVAAIKNVKIDGDVPNQQIVLRLDIIEGEWAGYYTKRYEHDSQNAGAQQLFQAKYKGDYRIQIPDDRNVRREHPEWDLRTLNGAIWCIEQSNTGFHWDGDTDHIMDLKGKIVGINVREGTFNGNVYTQIGKLETVEDVRKGLVKPMKPKKDNGTSSAVAAPAYTTVEVDDLPF